MSNPNSNPNSNPDSKNLPNIKLFHTIHHQKYTKAIIMSDPLDETFNFISKIDLLNLGSLIELRIKEKLSTNVQVSFTKERYCNSLE